MQVVSRLVRSETITEYESDGASAGRLADGNGEAHAYVVEFAPGGAIGRHEAGFGQLFIVVLGEGWVSGDDGVRVDVSAGDVALIDRGEQHAKGSASGMTAIMVQVRDLARPSPNSPA